ncbi:MAG: di-heme-cytochrome C peroxidase [Methylococcaceae bacterium]
MNLKHKKWLFSMTALMLSIMSLHVQAADYAVNGAYAAKVPSELDQGMSPTERLEWWYTSQGSRIVPYNWFLALESADSEQLIRSNENLEQRLRFIAWPAHSKWNPDGLPIGFIIDKDAKTGKSYMGVTCAACHTSKFEFNGKAVLTEGGPAHADFDRFVTEIGAALQAVLKDDQKFSRFAGRVLGSKANTVSASALKAEILQVATPLAERIKINHPPHPNGYGRLDAFGQIFNEGSVFSINEPTNAKLSNAPVSYPVVWDAPQHDILQWNGSAVNAGIGPYTRNTGEVIGVFGDMRIQKVTIAGSSKLRYEHHINIKALGRLEELLVKMESPVWPETILPAIDKKKAELGKQHYDKNCVSCHQPISRADPKRHIAAQMIPIAEVGTDPTMAMNAATSTAKTGLLEGQPMLPLTKYLPSLGVIEVFGPVAPTAKVVGNGILGALRDELGLIKLGTLLPDYIAASKKNALIDGCDVKTQGAACYKPPRYKARPLNGIWASAPFLHNGSIPNLTELLKKPEQRIAKFNVGSWEFDPINVGFSTAKEQATSEFDTSLTNDSNRGHDYGTNLTNSEKMELIEYIKTL